MFIRQLDCLVAIAREKHFAKAPQVCHVSQPALSSAIRSLEKELGIMIVQRGRRFMGLTLEGERVPHSMLKFFDLRNRVQARSLLLPAAPDVISRQAGKPLQGNEPRR
jgi:DNA-binding transcriptional LysR family regulator